MFWGEKASAHSHYFPRFYGSTRNMLLRNLTRWTLAATLAIAGVVLSASKSEAHFFHGGWGSSSSGGSWGSSSSGGYWGSSSSGGSWGSSSSGGSWGSSSSGGWGHHRWGSS